jgi:hypothetical protein
VFDQKQFHAMISKKFSLAQLASHLDLYDKDMALATPSRPLQTAILSLAQSKLSPSVYNRIIVRALVPWMKTHGTYPEKLNAIYSSLAILRDKNLINTDTAYSYWKELMFEMYKSDIPYQQIIHDSRVK